MKIKGKRLEGTNEITIIIPRYNADDIEFTAKAILDYTELHKKLKEPKAPNMLKKGEQVQNLNDKGFLNKKEKYAENIFNYMVCISLLATEGLEWEKVNLDDVNTWENWEKELKESGLTNSEINYIAEKVRDVNSLNQDKLDEARDHFLQMRSIQKDQ